MPEKAHFPLDLNKFPPSLFTEYMRPILQILAKIMGKEHDVMIDREILGMFALMMKPGVVLEIPTYLENYIYNQFMSLSLTGSFRFPSLVTYLFLYSHVENFTQLGLNIVSVNKNKHSVVSGHIW